MIELLVSISIIALLISLILPVLGGAKEAARAVGCASNLRQMLVGWETVMVQRDMKISNTVFPAISRDEVLWHTLLRETFQHVPNANQAIEGNAWLDCPTRRSRSEISYTNRSFGYAVNSRWLPNEPWASNEGQRWDQIRNPAEYLWFTEPALEPSGGGTPIAKAYFGISALFDWGVAYPHGASSEGDAGNGMGQRGFADGHVAPQRFRELPTETDDVGTPRWLLND
ncbi:MAG: hypothetical protein AAGJ38_02860 [Planctomycetota bacterium]